MVFQFQAYPHLDFNKKYKKSCMFIMFYHVFQFQEVILSAPSLFEGKNKKIAIFIVFNLVFKLLVISASIFLQQKRTENQMFS